MTAKQAKGLMAPDGSQYVTLTDGAGNLGDIAVTLDAADIEIGAVEIKNATTDDRVVVSAAGSLQVAGVGTAGTAAGGVITVQGVAAMTPLLATATQSGTWTVQPGNTANTTAWLVTSTGPSTGTMSSVASSATSVTVLASNASRKGASVYNDSTAILYLAVSATTASATAYTVQLPANAFFELPPCRDGSVFTGQLTGIWASANGNARITEWT